MTQSMDDLHCNNFSGCRKLLSLEWELGVNAFIGSLCMASLGVHTAIVTSCSHIYCIDCATNIFDNHNVCPACDAVLYEAEELVRCNLRPSESWKSTILSGLPPNVILDIASRAFSFHSYQITQGKAYDEKIIGDLRERTAILEAELASTQHDAAAEIDPVQQDLDVERRRNHEFQEMHKQNSRSYMKMKSDFDALKRQRSVFSSNDVAMSYNNNTTAPAQAAPQPRQAFVPAPNPDNRSHSSASQAKYRQGLDTRNENWNASNRQQENTSTRPFHVVSSQGQGQGQGQSQGRNGGNATRNGHNVKSRHSTDGNGLNVNQQQQLGRSASDGFVGGSTNKGGGGGGPKSYFVSSKQPTGHVYGQQPIAQNQHAQHGGGVKPRGFRPASFSRDQ
ncbi:hypothetical protein JCM5353_006014 [Sporobolomyces roseus]